MPGHVNILNRSVAILAFDEGMFEVSNYKPSRLEYVTCEEFSVVGPLAVIDKKLQLLARVCRAEIETNKRAPKRPRWGNEYQRELCFATMEAWEHAFHKRVGKSGDGPFSRVINLIFQSIESDLEIGAGPVKSLIAEWYKTSAD